MILLDAVQDTAENAQTLGALATAIGGGSGTLFLAKWIFFDRKISSENEVKHALMEKEMVSLKDKLFTLERDHKNTYEKLDDRIRDLERAVNDNTNKILMELRNLNSKK